MVDQEEKSITALISKMQRKKDDLLTELEKVQKWLTTVESIINQGKAIVGEPEPVIGEISGTLSKVSAEIHGEVELPETKAGRILRLIGEKTHAEKIKEILSEGKRLKLQEISDEFTARNWPINSKSLKNRLQVIKNNLVGKVGKAWFDYDESTKTWGLKGQSEQPQPKPLNDFEATLSGLHGETKEVTT